MGDKNDDEKHEEGAYKDDPSLAKLTLLHTQNDIAFVVVAPFILFVCKLARVAVLASCDSAKF